MSNYDPMQQLRDDLFLTPLRESCVEPSDPDASLWRYMDFTKFMSMLERGQLFFARVDKLGDPYEGLFPKANRVGRPQFAALLGTMFGSEAQALQKEELAKKNRQRIMVSCWHKNDYESAAMWKLYARSNEAIAIRSTCRNLRSALDSSSVLISVVQYLDYNRDSTREGSSDFLIPIIHKRKSFEHEQEVRAITWIGQNDTIPEFGLWKELKQNLNGLIEEIRVAPESQTWFTDLIKDVMMRYGLKKAVIRSSLDEPY